MREVRLLDQIESMHVALCASYFLKISELSLLKTFSCQRISVSLTSPPHCVLLLEKGNKVQINKQLYLWYFSHTGVNWAGIWVFAHWLYLSVPHVFLFFLFFLIKLFFFWLETRHWECQTASYGWVVYNELRTELLMLPVETTSKMLQKSIYIYIFLVHVPIL